MKLRNTFVALALFAGLALWLYFYEYKGEEGRKKAEEDQKKVFVFQTDKAEGLEIAKPGSRIVLEKKGDEWRLTEPIAARADAEEVSSLLSTLSWLEADRTMKVQPDQLATYNLKDPPLKVTLKPGEGKPAMDLEVGDKAPIGSAYYAMKGAGGDVVTISSSVDRLLEETADKLRYKKVVGVDSWKVTRFSVTRGGTTTSFSKDGEAWRLETPSPFPADRSKVSNLLYDLTAISAEGFEPDKTDPAAVGLAAPEATLKIDLKDGPPIAVDFSAKDPNGVVRARRADMPEIFRLKGDALDKLNVAVAEYRDARVAPLDRWEITEVKAAGADGERTLVKDPQANWHWGSAEGPAADHKMVDDLLDALDAAKAGSFREGSEAAKGIGIDPPRVRLSLKAGAAPPVEVKVGAEQDGKVLVASSTSPAVYVLDKALADKIVETAGALKETGAAAASSAAPGGDKPSAAVKPGVGGAPGTPP